MNRDRENRDIKTNDYVIWKKLDFMGRRHFACDKSAGVAEKGLSEDY